jgi:transcriptional regulator with XRE-family HTH domain
MWKVMIYSAKYSTVLNAVIVIIAMNQKLRTIIADNIRNFRNKKHWSQEDLADEAGLHRNYVGNIERSEYSISTDQLSKIADALKVKPHLLLIENAYHFPDDVLNLLNKF